MAATPGFFDESEDTPPHIEEAQMNDMFDELIHGQNLETTTAIAINKFDKSREQLYEKIVVIATERPPFGQYRTNLADIANQTCFAFGNLAVPEEGDSPEDVIARLAGVYLHDETERLSLLSELAPETKFIESGDIASVLTEIYEKVGDYIEFQQAAISLYTQGLSVDVTAFINDLESSRQYEVATENNELTSSQDPKSKFIEYGKKAGSIALSAAVGAVVASSILMSKRFKK